MGNLVCDNSEFSCPFCSSSLKITVTDSSVYGDSQLIANTSNHFFPPPGGMCSITQSPCVPSPIVIDPGQSPIMLNDLPALGGDVKLMCSQGGLIQLKSSAQEVGQHTKTEEKQDKDTNAKCECEIFRANLYETALSYFNNEFVLYWNDFVQNHNFYLGNWDGKTYTEPGKPVINPLEGKKVNIGDKILRGDTTKELEGYKYEDSNDNIIQINHVKIDKDIYFFDCSYFVCLMFAKCGKELPFNPYTGNFRTSHLFEEISEEEAETGDVVLYPGHVGIYVKDGGSSNVLSSSSNHSKEYRGSKDENTPNTGEIVFENGHVDIYVKDEQPSILRTDIPHSSFCSPNILVGPGSINSNPTSLIQTYSSITFYKVKTFGSYILLRYKCEKCQK